LISSGRSRYDWIHFANIEWMTVSEVGRTISSSSRRDSGSGTTPDASCPVALRRVCVTIAHSLAKPSTCSASFARKDLGMNRGK
jgi:hypothetical protein